MILTATRLTIGVAMSRKEESAPELLHTPAASEPLKLQMRLASDPRLLKAVRSIVSELAAAAGFGDRQCRSITLAVDEALSNVIRHAYKNQCDHEIELDFQAWEDCVEFIFVDRGEPVDPARICSHPLDDASLGGRGTHLIRQIMDEVSYERLPAQNRLRLKKYRPGAKRKA
jgi:serine/threonine-protein kinase RsbW